MRKSLLFGVSGLILLAAATSGSNARAMTGPATQVDASAKATYGEISLGAGFANDPYTVSITSGGSIDASNVSGGCVGMVARAPDFQLTYDAGSLPLAFGTRSSSDTTLAINGPDGQWSCDDDSGGNRNARVTYRSPRSGVYDIWVGAYGGGTHAADLYITERVDGGNRDSGAGRPDSSLTAIYGEISLSAGFADDPRRVSIYSGGGIDASTLGGSCVGMIAAAPDFQLTYEAGSLPLTFRVAADGDTTLVINGPDGDWHCDDDSGGSNDPEVTFRKPSSGVYDIWVGAYGGNSVSGELAITERDR